MAILDKKQEKLKAQRDRIMALYDKPKAPSKEEKYYTDLGKKEPLKPSTTPTDIVDDYLWQYGGDESKNSLFTFADRGITDIEKDRRDPNWMYKKDEEEEDIEIPDLVTEDKKGGGVGDLINKMEDDKLKAPQLKSDLSALQAQLAAYRKDDDWIDFTSAAALSDAWFGGNLAKSISRTNPKNKKTEKLLELSAKIADMKNRTANAQATAQFEADKFNLGQKQQAVLTQAKIDADIERANIASRGRALGISDKDEKAETRQYIKYMTQAAKGEDGALPDDVSRNKQKHIAIMDFLNLQDNPGMDADTRRDLISPSAYSEWLSRTLIPTARGMQLKYAQKWPHKDKLSLHKALNILTTKYVKDIKAKEEFGEPQY